MQANLFVVLHSKLTQARSLTWSLPFFYRFYILDSSSLSVAFVLPVFLRILLRWFLFSPFLTWSVKNKKPKTSSNCLRFYPVPASPSLCSWEKEPLGEVKASGTARKLEEKKCFSITPVATWLVNQFITPSLSTGFLCEVYIFRLLATSNTTHQWLFTLIWCKKFTQIKGSAKKNMAHGGFYFYSNARLITSDQ